MLFRGRRYQRGNGFGSIFAGLLRRGVAPLVKKGLKYLGSKALETGVKVGTDMQQGRSFKDSVRNRFQETLGSVRKDGEHKYQRLINEDSDDEDIETQSHPKRKFKLGRKKKEDKSKLMKGSGMRAKRRSVITKKKILKKKAKKLTTTIKKVSKKKKSNKKKKNHTHLMERDLF